MRFNTSIHPDYTNISKDKMKRLIGRNTLSQSGFIESSFDTYSKPTKSFIDPFKKILESNKQLIEPRNKVANTKDSKFNFDANEGHTTLSEGEKIRVGDVTITVTDPYGIRSFKGREGQHSRGIDITTSTGKAHALSDGIIEDVKLQGDGSVITPTQGKAAGYYVIVRNKDGSRTQYMHLDPMSENDIKNLKGRELKRGDEIWGYTIGSGSMKGKHVKIRHYGDNPKYNIDPSQLLRGEAYSYIPDSNGNNILNYKKGGSLLRY